ncbi:hypothetical protein L208DRAFT_1376630 [Tricholoma matsutake]|nr:hypothetical protein L208DRAFT_1376630 [Tricholoma matsutake 945]
MAIVMLAGCASFLIYVSLHNIFIMPEFAVEFTSENQAICGGHCKQRLEPTADIFYLHNNDPTLPGRKVCKKCHQHYIGKATTRHASGTFFYCCIGILINLVMIAETNDIELIQQQVAMAQRGDSIIYPIGSSNPFGMSSSQQGYLKLLPAGPVVMTPAMNNNMQPVQFPAEFRNLLLANGYQAAHQCYVEFKQHLSAQVYAYGLTAEVVIIKFWMKTQVPNHKTALLVSDICEMVGSIPVHIGVRDLKLTGVMAVVHKYFKWTKGLALTPDDVELRSANWEEYLPKGEGHFDCDAISDWYFKVLELVLALPYEKYEIAYQHSIEDDEFRQPESEINPPFINLNKDGARNKATRKPRPREDKTPLFFPNASPPASQSNISASNEGLTYKDIPQAVHAPIQDSLITNLNRQYSNMMPSHHRDLTTGQALPVPSNKLSSLDASQLRCALLAQKAPS